jgi:hypothetical protein
MTDTMTKVHQWTPGRPVTDSSRCTQCGTAYAGRYRHPHCGPVDPAELAAHLDARGWTKDTIIRHLAEAHGGTYITARTTKRGEVEHHKSCHEMEAERAATFVRRWIMGTIIGLREGFGCRLDDGGFATADDEWMREHIGYHEDGNDLGGRLI